MRTAFPLIDSHKQCSPSRLQRLLGVSKCVTSTASPRTRPRSSPCSASSTATFGNLPPMPGVFPDYPAPVIRNTGDKAVLRCNSLHVAPLEFYHRTCVAAYQPSVQLRSSASAESAYCRMAYVVRSSNLG